VSILVPEDPLDPKIAALPIAKWPPHGSPDKAYIVGHPLGRIICFSFDNTRVVHLESDRSDGGPVRIYYGTPTSPGSSGSPVFNARWEIIGVHHVGNARIAASAANSVIANEGILISSVNAAIRTKWQDPDR
jgi:V8-like Glu-specific endopeptidase